MIDTRSARIEMDGYSEGAGELEDIKRCLMTLYTTKEGTQPLDRQFGLSSDFISDPIPVAMNKYTLEVVRKTAMYEPRVQVKEVTYMQDDVNGMMIPTIHIGWGDEDE